MTRDQFKIIISMLTSNYKGFVVDTKEKFEFWFEALKDISYELCNKAVMKITMECEYQPTIASIRKQALGITTNKLTTTEGTELIFEVVRKFGTHQALKALEWLKSKDESAYKVMKAIGYRNLCLSNPNFSRDIVIKMYKETSTSNEKQMLLPRQFAREIAQIQANGLAMLEGEL